MPNTQSLRDSLHLLTSIPEEEWHYFEGLLESVTLAPQEILIHQDAIPKHVYFILEGLIKQRFIDHEGHERAKAFLFENQFCANYLAILTNQRANFEMIAMESCELLALKTEDIESLFRHHYCWQEVGRKIAENVLVAKEIREYQMLMLNAEERYSAFCVNFPKLFDRLPLYEIASYLGITPVALSNIRRKTGRSV